MTIITRKVKLAAAPVPPFVGTRIAIETTDRNLAWGLKTAIIAEGSERIQVAWGDGMTEEVQTLGQVVHTYAVPGRYEILISDDVSTLGISAMSGTYQTVYAPMVCAFKSNARKLTGLAQFAFSKCSQLSEMDFRETSVRALPQYGLRGCAALTGLDGLPRNIEDIGSNAFTGCELLEVVRFPNVVNVQGGADSLPFKNCTALREIHFAEANKEALLASPAFQFDPEHLGSPHATVLFDL